MERTDTVKNKYPFWNMMFVIAGVNLALQVFIAVLVMILIYFAQLWTDVAISQKEIIKYLSLISTPASFFLTWAVVKSYKKGDFKFGFTIKNVNPLLIVLSYALILCFSVIVEPLANMLPEELYKKLEEFMSGGTTAIIATVVLAPIFEEFIFRGLVQKMAIYRYGALAGIIFGGIIFGVIHIIPQQVIHASFVGIILGYVYYKTGSIYTPIIIHFINNGVAMFMFYCTDIDPQTQTKTMIDNDPLYWILYVVCFAVVVYGMARIVKDILLSKKNRD